MKTCWVIFFVVMGVATSAAQIFTDSRRTFSYTDDSTVMPGDVCVHHILFNFNNCLFYPEYEDTVKQISNFLIKHPNIRIEISLHTDYRGSTEINRKLTECRATELKVFLVSYGASPKQLDMVGKGKDEPLISQETIDAEPDAATRERYHRINSRVEVKIIQT